MGRNRTTPKREHVGFCARVLNPRHAKFPKEEKWFDLRLFRTRQEAEAAARKQYPWATKVHVEGVRVAANYFDHETNENLKRFYGRWDEPVMWSNPQFKGAYKQLPQRRGGQNAQK